MFPHKGNKDMGAILVNFEICQFIKLPRSFEYFSKKKTLSEYQSFLNEGGMINPSY